ncbi:DUF1345 domain-containing protein [Leifsonia poae]|uniref:DUF1345 domain-containing protein n=2 Tax=Leifsonia poae TaxID=110933 RepID=A0A9W6LYX3_9MICO|nr:hypothetical protein GCM10017584_12170 [Leifsonia poae]
MIVAFAVGVVVAIVTGLPGGWAYAGATGWAAACVVYVVWVWAVIWRFGPTQTKAHAIKEDPGHRISELLLLIASIASVVAIVIILVAARHSAGIEKLGLAVLAVASVALSWALVHTLFTLRYARLYYRGTEGGIDFNQKEAPQYSDFAYLSFTLGMTYQVSDTNIGNTAIRNTVLRHTLLSYLFGSVILATTVNLIAGLT